MWKFDGLYETTVPHHGALSIQETLTKNLVITVIAEFWSLAS
jgi:hypothetical protein